MVVLCVFLVDGILGVQWLIFLRVEAGPAALLHDSRIRGIHRCTGLEDILDLMR